LSYPDRIASSALSLPLVGLLFAPPTPSEDAESKAGGPFDGEKVGVDARLMTGWQYRRESVSPELDETRSGFFLHQARIELEAKPIDALEMEIGADLSDALEGGDRDRVPYLRDAWADVKLHRSFRVRVGRFKRPYSRIELRSAGKLPFRGRGVNNSVVVEDMQWGDRALGMMLWGKIRRPDLRWHVAVMDPGLYLHADSIGRGVDALARLEYEPTEWLELGAGGAFKHTLLADGRDSNAFATGADLRVKHEGLEWVVEVLAAEDPRLADRPWAVGAATHLAYAFLLPHDLALQPTVFAEWLDQDMRYLEYEALRTVVGMNLLWRDYVRLMPQVELRRGYGRFAPATSRETYYVMITVQI
jgi:hypothetical protein